jgi:hypothetical protein
VATHGRALSAEDAGRAAHVGYQTLLKEFVVERLYEEERRAGIIRERVAP